jgi:hypothetical protein
VDKFFHFPKRASRECTNNGTTTAHKIALAPFAGMPAYQDRQNFPVGFLLYQLWDRIAVIGDYNCPTEKRKTRSSAGRGAV